MNAFLKHHQDNIRFNYRCFDRILLNGVIQPFQQPERVVGFFNTYRQLYPVSRELLRDIAGQFQNWVKNRSEKWHAPILEAPPGRRDEFVETYFRKAKPDQLVVILKAREPARILIAIGNKKDNRWHLEIAQRWVIQYNFYVNDRDWGRMFVRLCPYFPSSARLCLNQHSWLANQMREAGIDFQQCANAFLKCSDPKRLQELSDSLTARDLLLCGQKWLTCFTPFFTEKERQHAGCQHRLFFAQVEYADNLIFHRIIKGFMVQGGCPDGTGYGNGGYNIKAEFNNTKHVPGILSMARGPSPDSASCQFFIMLENYPSLDGQYSAFGKVMDEESMKTVRAIGDVATGSNDRPKDKVTIQKAEVKETAK